jgi:hypothetical protein
VKTWKEIKILRILTWKAIRFSGRISSPAHIVAFIRDIQQLDAAKKNLTSAIAALNHLHMQEPLVLVHAVADKGGSMR